MWAWSDGDGESVGAAVFCQVFNVCIVRGWVRTLSWSLSCLGDGGHGSGKCHRPQRTIEFLYIKTSRVRARIWPDCESSDLEIGWNKAFGLDFWQMVFRGGPDSWNHHHQRFASAAFEMRRGAFGAPSQRQMQLQLLHVIQTTPLFSVKSGWRYCIVVVEFKDALLLSRICAVTFSFGK